MAKEEQTEEQIESEEVYGYHNMLTPPLEEIVDKAGSKFLLVTLSAQRSNDINLYYQGLGSGMAGVAPPQVGGEFSSYLSVAFEELYKDKVQLSREVPEDTTPNLEDLAPAEENPA